MEQILPGVSIEVRPEGLIIPGVVTISAIGMVGTASKGPIGQPVIIGSPAEAREVFGDPDAFVQGASNELTLVRALDLAYDHGARDVIAVRVGTGAASAAFTVTSPGGDCCALTAATPGSWANALEINIADAEEAALVAGEEHAGAANFVLDHTTVLQSVRNAVSVVSAGSTTPILPTVVHNTGGPPASGEVDIDTATGTVTFAAGEAPAGDAQVFVTYVVPVADSRKVTLRHGGAQEVFTVASGGHFVDLVNDASDLVTGVDGANEAEVPDAFASVTEFRKFGTGGAASGTNGGIFVDDAATAAAYETGLDALSNEPAFIIVAAGQGHGLLGANITAHVNAASSDENKRERIGIIGSGAGESLDATLEHTLASDRVVLVAPGIQVNDPVSGRRVTLSGGYAAAAVAGMISGAPVNRSLTNKVLAIAGLEEEYTQAELRRLVLARVLAIEKKLGFRTVKGITTSTNTAWHQITTRRIVDKAKFGVRSAANPYIGLLNNERVRAAMRSTINSFLTEMVIDEELVSYELEVTATRDDERRGIARVTMVLRPTFSIDFIKVTMFLE
jgi:hypothetical protein